MSSHPSKDIAGSKGKELAGKKIALLVTSSVASFKAPEIARELMRHGADVHAVMSPSTEKMIGADRMVQSFAPDGIFTANTIDKYLTRVYIVAFSHGRIQGSQEHAVRQVMGKIVAEKASKLTYSQMCHEMVLGKMGSDVYNEAKKVCPLRHVGVRKSKLLSMPLSLGEPQKPAEEEMPTPLPETVSQ